jgi:hypothetical protein
MKDLYPVLAAEGLKLKRTLALRLAIWCPTVIVLLVFGIYAGRSGKRSDADLLTGFAQLTMTIWTIIFVPAIRRASSCTRCCRRTPKRELEA